MDFDLILNGNNEFSPGLNRKTYNVLNTNTPEKITNMCNFFDSFHIHSTTTLGNHYMGIDFEFNKVGKHNSDIALMQINLESDNSEQGFIFILFPPKLSRTQLEKLIKLMTEVKIIKILHGAESLDIPYMFRQLFINNDQINNFCKNFYDTKFLCDYSNAYEKKKEKCSIYFMLCYNGIITTEKFNELNKIVPIYDQHIDINKITSEGLKYALYDVLYLPEMIKNYMEKGIVYSKILQQITSLIYKNKHGIDTVFDDINNAINAKNKDLNTKFLFINSKIITLQEIWECYYYYIYDSNGYMNYIKDIDGFKKFMKAITKLIVYLHIFKKYKVSKSANKNIHLPQEYFLKHYDKFSEYPELFAMLQDYYRTVESDIVNRITTLTRKN